VGSAKVPAANDLVAHLAAVHQPFWLRYVIQQQHGCGKPKVRQLGQQHRIVRKGGR